MNTPIDLEKKYKPLIIIAAIGIPLAVAALFAIKIEGYNFSFLPPIYATINGITAVVLIAALVAIKKGNRKLHEKLMKFAIFCSILFLLGYIAYHITSSPTPFGDSNHNGLLEPAELLEFQTSRLIYILLLVSHIILSIAVLPMVLITYVKGLAGNFESHKKWGKRTFPIWLFVAVSGVVVYLMIAPFYAR